MSDSALDDPLADLVDPFPWAGTARVPFVSDRMHRAIYHAVERAMPEGAIVRKLVLKGDGWSLSELGDDALDHVRFIVPASVGGPHLRVFNLSMGTLKLAWAEGGEQAVERVVRVALAIGV